MDCERHVVLFLIGWLVVFFLFFTLGDIMKKKILKKKKKKTLFPSTNLFVSSDPVMA